MGIFTYRLSQPLAKYLIVAVERGITSEVNYFDSLKEAKRTFGEIAHDYGYKPSEINASYLSDEPTLRLALKIIRAISR